MARRLRVVLLPLVALLVVLVLAVPATATSSETTRVNADSALEVQSTVGAAGSAVETSKGVATSTTSVTADFGSAFGASVAMIVVSELGDKTFFIAAILAMKHPRLVIFSGAILALALMTVLSAALGYALPMLLRPSVTHLLSIVFFFTFGIKMLREWYHMDPDEGREELEETEGELSKIENEKTTAVPDAETGRATDAAASAGPQYNQVLMGLRNLLYLVFTPIFIQTFTLTFLAEWGDRSQITTIAMATTQNPYGITIGGIVGHMLCTGLAVIGGRMLATRISVRTVTLLSAILFLNFAFAGFMYPPS